MSVLKYDDRGEGGSGYITLEAESPSNIGNLRVHKLRNEKYRWPSGTYEQVHLRPVDLPLARIALHESARSVMAEASRSRGITAVVRHLRTRMEPIEVTGGNDTLNLRGYIDYGDGRERLLRDTVIHMLQEYLRQPLDTPERQSRRAGERQMYHLSPSFGYEPPVDFESLVGVLDQLDIPHDAEEVRYYANHVAQSAGQKPG